MVHFEKITADKLEIIEEMIRSNEAYNVLENGCPTRTSEEVKKEYFYNTTGRQSYFIKADDTYIGLLDYMDEHNGVAWLGLLMIHGDYHGYGYGSNAYFLFEELLRRKGKPELRLGVMKDNNSAKRFWEGLGFLFIEEKKSSNGILVDCYQKIL